MDKPRPKTIDTDIWTKDQVQQFLRFTNADPMYPVFFLLFATGMRIGEVLALRWHYVNIEQRIITVRRNIDYAKNGYIFQEPKTKASRRTLPASNQVINMLVSVKQEQEKYKKILLCELPRIRIHDARHTFASILIHQGVDPKTLQTLMGQSEISTTLKIYTKVLPGATHEAMDRFSESMLSI
nr:site-specific integrase [Bacilli bacterium]